MGYYISGGGPEDIWILIQSKHNLRVPSQEVAAQSTDLEPV